MWQSYFLQIQNKYNMRVSTKNPLVIRYDGKDVTKNKSLDLLNNCEGTFINQLEKTVKYFTSKYHCYAIFGSDEVSFIFTNPMIVIEDLDKEKYNTSNEIIAMFSQYFFDYFNNLNRNAKVFWHGKCFSINKDKMISYLKFRSKIIKNVMTTYFLKRKDIHMGNDKLEDREEECKKFTEYESLKDIQDGILYFDGKRINLEEFYEGNIKIISKSVNDEMFTDLFEFSD